MTEEQKAKLTLLIQKHKLIIDYLTALKANLEQEPMTEKEQQAIINDIEFLLSEN